MTDGLTLSLLELQTEPKIGFVYRVQVYCVQYLWTPGGQGKQEEEAVMSAMSGQVHRVPQPVRPYWQHYAAEMLVRLDIYMSTYLSVFRAKNKKWRKTQNSTVP